MVVFVSAHLNHIQLPEVDHSQALRVKVLDQQLHTLVDFSLTFLLLVLQKKVSGSALVLGILLLHHEFKLALSLHLPEELDHELDSLVAGVLTSKVQAVLARVALGSQLLDQLLRTVVSTEVLEEVIIVVAATQVKKRNASVSLSGAVEV